MLWNVTQLVLAALVLCIGALAVFGTYAACIELWKAAKSALK